TQPAKLGHFLSSWKALVSPSRESDFEMRGMAADLGIVKGQPFKPDEKMKSVLDKAEKTASRMGHAFAYGTMSIKYYDDR
ncbi:hypothetical protein AB9E21_35230, partial [Rhizobium leguminosarum]